MSITSKLSVVTPIVKQEWNAYKKSSDKRCSTLPNVCQQVTAIATLSANSMFYHLVFATTTPAYQSIPKFFTHLIHKQLDIPGPVAILAKRC